jgi:hypothetical protein
VLDEFEALLPKFVKVFPADYKRVLAELEAQEAAAGNGQPPAADEFKDETVDVVGAPHTRIGDGE